MRRTISIVMLAVGIVHTATWALAQESDEPEVVAVVRSCRIQYDDGTSETLHPATLFVVRGTDGDRLYVRWTKRGWIEKRNVAFRSGVDLKQALENKRRLPCRANTINYGAALYSSGEYKLAMAQFVEALNMEPNSPWSANALGWYLAVCPDESLRDSERAIELCTRACESTNWEESMFITSLACAYAAAREFDIALKYIKKSLLMDQKFRGTRAEILRCIQEGRPYHSGDSTYAS